MKSLLVLFLTLITFCGYSQKLECEAIGVQIGYYDNPGFKKWTTMMYSTTTIVLTTQCMDVLGVYSRHFEIGEQVKKIVTDNWTLDGWESIDNDGKKCVIEVLHFNNNHETNIIIDYGKISWLYKIGGCK